MRSSRIVVLSLVCCLALSSCCHGDRDSTLLRWALEHSDPEAVRDMAVEHTEHPQPIPEELRQLLYSSSPSQLAQEALQVFQNGSLPLSERAVAGSVLEELVEDIDVANDLPTFGGIEALTDALTASQGVQSRLLQISALSIMATAASNNVKFQQALLSKERQAVPWLLQLVADHSLNDDGDITVLSPALRALSALTGNMDSSLTGLLSAGIDHPALAEASEDPAALRLLFEVADRFAPPPPPCAGQAPDSSGCPLPSSNPISNAAYQATCNPDAANHGEQLVDAHSGPGCGSEGVAQCDDGTDRCDGPSCTAATEQACGAPWEEEQPPAARKGCKDLKPLWRQVASRALALLGDLVALDASALAAVQKSSRLAHKFASTCEHLQPREYHLLEKQITLLSAVLQLGDSTQVVLTGDWRVVEPCMRAVLERLVREDDGDWLDDLKQVVADSIDRLSTATASSL